MAARGNKALTVRATVTIAIALSWAAGFVDTLSYLQLRHLYTSHMSGNTASFARGVSTADWSQVVRYGWTIASFMIGLLISAGMTIAQHREGIRSAFAAALGLEIGCLILFIAMGQVPTTPEALLIFLPAAAMGIQTVTVTRVGSMRVYTTYVTASLSKFAEAVAQYLFWLRDRTRGRFRKRIRRVLRITFRQEPAIRAAVTGGLWLAFLVGGACGAAGGHSWGLPALGIPVVLLTGVIGIDLSWPSALGERFRATSRGVHARSLVETDDKLWPR